MGLNNDQSKDFTLNDKTRAIIKRIAYEHGMSFEAALKYYSRSK